MSSSGRSIFALIRRVKFSLRVAPKSQVRWRLKVSFPRKVRACDSLIGTGGRAPSKKRALYSSKRACMYSIVGITYEAAAIDYIAGNKKGEEDVWRVADRRVITHIRIILRTIILYPTRTIRFVRTIGPRCIGTAALVKGADSRTEMSCWTRS